MQAPNRIPEAQQKLLTCAAKLGEAGRGWAKLQLWALELLTDQSSMVVEGVKLRPGLPWEGKKAKAISRRYSTFSKSTNRKVHCTFSTPNRAKLSADPGRLLRCIRAFCFHDLTEPRPPSPGCPRLSCQAVDRGSSPSSLRPEAEKPQCQKNPDD